MSVNKVVYGTTTIVDLTPSTVTPETLMKDVTAFDKHGDLITGTHEDREVILQDKTVIPTKSSQSITADDGYDAISSVSVEAIPDKYIDTSTANATSSDIVEGKTAYVKGKMVTGSIEKQTMDSDLVLYEGQSKRFGGYYLNDFTVHSVGNFSRCIPSGYFVAIDKNVTALENGNVARFGANNYGGYVFANISGKGFTKCTVTNGTLGTNYVGSGMVLNDDGTIETNSSSPITLSDKACYIFVARRSQSSGRLTLTFS